MAVKKKLPITAQAKATRVTFSILFVSVCVSFVWMVWPYFLPVLMGGILALITRPIYRKLLGMNIRPQFAAGAVTGGLTLLVVIPFVVFSILAVKQGIAIGKSMGNAEAFSVQSLVHRVDEWRVLDAFDLKTDEMETHLRDWIQGAAKFGTEIILGIASKIPSILLQLVLTLVTCFFLLIDGQRLMGWIIENVPMDPDVRVKISNSFKNMAIASIFATVAAGLAQSFVIFLSFVFLGVPGAFLAGGSTFILAWIPVMGCSPVWILGTIYLYGQDSLTRAGFMVASGLLAGVVDNVVRPLILKGRSNMHPLVSLIAIFGGIGLFGILGVFLGPILAAIMISLLQVWPAVVGKGDAAPE